MTFKKLGHTIAYFSSILTGFYLFTSYPGHHKREKWQSLLGWDYAHRGLYDNTSRIPENSMPAFRRAVRNGYGIELDVHLTADNQLIVFHDDTLTRMCGVNKKINRLPLYEIEQYTLLDSNEHIPLFKDVLTTIDGRVPLIIELKVDDGNQNLLCPLVCQQLEKYRGHYCIESFHPFALQWFKRHRPDIVRGQLSCNFFKENPHCDLVLLLMTHLMTNFFTRPDFIAYKYLDTHIPAFQLSRLLGRTMTVLWTIQSRPAYERYKGKYDLLIFENFKP